MCKREGEWECVKRETVHEREGKWESVEGETVRDYSYHSPSLSLPLLAHCLLHSLPITTLPLPERVERKTVRKYRKGEEW